MRSRYARNAQVVARGCRRIFANQRGMPGLESRTGVERLLARNVDTYVVEHAPCAVEGGRPLAHA